MQRRAFLKKSAIGVGALAGIYGGVLKAEGDNPNQHSGSAAHSIGDGAGNAEEKWGTNAAVLKSPWSKPPSADDLLADQEHALVLDRFYLVGGQGHPTTSTECRISYTSDTLFVVFRCQESDMSFPYANLDPDLWRETNWHSMHGLPSAANNWPPYPDEVDILIQPNPSVSSYFQFAATPQGLRFGCQRQLSFNVDTPADQPTVGRGPSEVVNQVEGFKAIVTRGANEWLVFFEIPWQALGGKPKSYFGFLPMRTRWRDGEFSTPVALGFNESMPVDLLIETYFSGTAEVRDSESSLCQLPSGILRWQQPAVLTYPDTETCQQIWRMESSLTTPTDKNNLAQRLFLTQRWIDLMTQEGFVTYPRSWGIFKDDLTLSLIRQKVNAALQKNDSKQACQVLDTYLDQLDKMSRWWYADGSPGDILTDAWTPVTSAESLEVQGSALLMRCMAGSHKVELRLVLPKTGGVRIYGSDEGYWRPADLLPLKAIQTPDSCSIETAEGKVVVTRGQFSISFYDAAGNRVMQIGAGSLAFRFGADGGILAIDFKNRLAPDEVIYGFGERYNRFNQNGNVLTLWGIG